MNLPAKLATDALRRVPLRGVSESAKDFHARVFDWGAPRPTVDQAAVVLMRVCHDLADAMPEPEKRALTDTVKGQSRADRNEYMREYMKTRRASSKSVNANGVA